MFDTLHAPHRRSRPDPSRRKFFFISGVGYGTSARRRRSEVAAPRRCGLLNEKYTADQALAAGLVNEVVAEGTVVARPRGEPEPKVIRCRSKSDRRPIARD